MQLDSKKVSKKSELIHLICQFELAIRFSFI